AQPRKAAERPSVAAAPPIAASAPTPSPATAQASAVTTPAEAPQAAPAVAEAALPEPAPESAPVSAAVGSTPPSTTKPAPVAKAPALAGELKLLAAAQQALREQQLPRALEFLDEHAARYPRGALRPERLAARAVVLCRMGEANAGLMALRRLESETPSSPLLGWARDACGE
ncbi:MAG TPA: hypothetical protein VJV78_26620, partial [Polyangiales bacterium]|nr:hypothetical protein [Polyangiales bacterium]